MAGTDKTNNSVVCQNWMSDGNGGWQPVPSMLTQAEAIRYLRLDAIDVKNPMQTLGYYRRKGLKAVQVSKQILYKRADLDEFVDTIIAENHKQIA